MDYSKLSSIALSSIPSGAFISFPFPRRDDAGTLLDCFFIYGVNLATQTPLRPSACIAVNQITESCDWLDCRDIFSKIKFKARPFIPQEGAYEARIEAESLYENVREEFALNNFGDFSMRYASLVSQASPPAFMAYYRTLAPEIFTE